MNEKLEVTILIITGILGFLVCPLLYIINIEQNPFLAIIGATGTGIFLIFWIWFITREVE